MEQLFLPVVPVCSHRQKAHKLWEIRRIVKIGKKTALLRCLFSKFPVSQCYRQSDDIFERPISKTANLTTPGSVGTLVLAYSLYRRSDRLKIPQMSG